MKRWRARALVFPSRPRSWQERKFMSSWTMSIASSRRRAHRITLFDLLLWGARSWSLGNARSTNASLPGEPPREAMP